MNRKQRRAARKQGPSGSGQTVSADPARQLLAEARYYRQQHRLDDAARAYRRLLALRPDDAQVSNDLGWVLQAQGKLAEAATSYARALGLMPQLFGDFDAIYGTLIALVPSLGQAVQRNAAAWPSRLAADRLFDPGSLQAMADNPLLLCILRSAPVRNVALEHLLTSLRLSLLGDALADRAVSDSVFALCCALAEQCFINEHVFATTPDEEAQVEQLVSQIETAITAPSRAIGPIKIAALAMYRPLHVLPFAAGLLERKHPGGLADVVTHQVRQPMEELALRDQIARLTTIDDDVSLRVRQQYEENPYPRWTRAAGGVEPTTIDRHLRELFPTTPFSPVGKSEDVDILIAGCGTGNQAITIAEMFPGARLLAIDLSLASLAFARRNTPAHIAPRLQYAQADILKLATIDRSFDVIFATGVLHHMADPFEGWRILLTRLRPGGLMNVGLYSRLGCRDVEAARDYISEQGYRSSAAEIRRCRQDLLATPFASVARYNDFFSTSECRDMLFHTQESRVDIPAIKTFIAAQGLRFLGFELGPRQRQACHAQFAAAGWSMSNLDRWHEFETKYPDTFGSMYQIWAQTG